MHRQSVGQVAVNVKSLPDRDRGHHVPVQHIDTIDVMRVVDVLRVEATRLVIMLGLCSQRSGP